MTAELNSPDFETNSKYKSKNRIFLTICFYKPCTCTCIFEIKLAGFFFLENKLTTTGVAIIASVSTLFAISLFVTFFMGRHIMKNKTKRHHNTVYVPKNEKPPQTYVDLSTIDDNHAYSTLGSTVPETPYNVIGDSPDKI